MSSSPTPYTRGPMISAWPRRSQSTPGVKHHRSDVEYVRDAPPNRSDRLYLDWLIKGSLVPGTVFWDRECRNQWIGLPAPSGFGHLDQAAGRTNVSDKQNHELKNNPQTA